MGIATGVDLDAMIDAGRLAEAIVGHQLPSELPLADLGADVVKVEPTPAGDHTRGLTGFAAGFFAYLNGNKRSLAIDKPRRARPCCTAWFQASTSCSKIMVPLFSDRAASIQDRRAGGQCVPRGRMFRAISWTVMKPPAMLTSPSVRAIG
jgi:hypothetical protein